MSENVGAQNPINIRKKACFNR